MWFLKKAQQTGTAEHTRREKQHVKSIRKKKTKERHKEGTSIDAHTGKAKLSIDTQWVVCH